jgi:hypothetical protein
LWVQKRPVAEVEKGRLLRLQSALSSLKPQPLLTLLDLVSAHKQLQTLGVLSADVAPDAANIHVITGGGIQRGGEAVLGPTHTRTAAKAHTQQQQMMMTGVSTNIHTAGSSGCEPPLAITQTNGGSITITHYWRQNEQPP